jgi:hypothetical protein
MSNASNSAVKLGGPNAWWIWSLAVTFVVFLFSVQTGYAIVSGNVKDAVGLSVTQVATIAATYTWVFALFQFYGGAASSSFVTPRRSRTPDSGRASGNSWAKCCPACCA